jgi:outer membrane protein assembly factor BamB
MCKFAVSAAPAVSTDSIYVPLSSDRMQAFPFEAEGLGSFTFVSKGIGSGRPIITDKTVSWPTSNGDLNVAARYGKNKKSVSYRLSSDNAIVSPPTYKSGILFVTSLDGFVYAIDEEEGSIKWEISTGAGITQSAIPIGDSVYVVSSNGKLFRMDAKTGDPVWDNPIENVAKYLGSGKSNLYFTDGYGQLIVVNADSGAITSRVDAGEIAYAIPNQLTDRLYIGTKSGTVQCLREVASKVPYFHAGEITDSASRSEPIASADDAMSEEDSDAIGEADVDPFKVIGSDDPEEEEEMSEEEDPFKPKGGGGF